jgi:hypothetical protein
MAIETMAIWTKTNPASTKPLEEAVKTKGALEPLIQAVKKSVAPKSPKKKANSVPPPDDKLLLYVPPLGPPLRSLLDPPYN